MDSKFQQGLYGESIIRKLLKDCEHQYGQIDLISYDKKCGKIYMYEIKHQQRFIAPPFDGHGLPPYQFDFRLLISRLTGMIPFLVIIEPEIDFYNEYNMFYQNMFVLDNLTNDKKYITSGYSKRLIFNIDSFLHTKIKADERK